LNRSIIWLIAAVGLVAAVSWWGLRPRATGATRYRTAAAERGAIEATVSATGTIQPVEQVEVGSQVSGTVQKLHADYNSRVTAGQVLCQLEPSSFRARAVQAEAAVARAEAGVHDGDRALRRAHELRDQDVISEVDLEAAEVAKQQRDADLQSARAQLQVARVDLEHTTIRSPIEGVVIARTINLGQTVAASLQAPKLFVIARNLAQMQVETRIDEADIGRIHPGLPVTFTVDAYSDMNFHGRVQQVRLEPITEQGVVTYTTVIATQNPDQKLRPGMTANVSVAVARRENALKVPNAALRFRPPAPAGAKRVAMTQAATPSPGGAAARSAGVRRDTGGSPEGGAGHAGARHWPDAGRGMRAGREGAAGPAPDDSSSLMKPGTVYVLRGGKPVAVQLMSGITDGAMTEVLAADLEPDDPVIIGYDVTTRGQNLQPPPGMGGPFRGPGGRGAGGR
jgi:HlyD family secretion protein